MAKLICDRCGAIIQTSTNRNTVCPYCGTGYLTVLQPGYHSVQQKKTRRFSLKQRRKLLILVAAVVEAVLLVLLMLLVVIPEIRYNKVLSLLDQRNYADAIPILEKLDGYRNSRYMLDFCEKLEKAKGEHSEQQIAYIFLNDRTRVGYAYKLDPTREIFADNHGVRDSILWFAVGATAIMVAVVLIVLIAIPRVKYIKALELMGQGRFAEALAAFEKMNGYKDSERKIEICLELIKEQSD